MDLHSLFPHISPLHRLDQQAANLSSRKRNHFRICNKYSLICLTQEPKFVDVFWIPESENSDDDKIFFFFRETAVEGAQGLGKHTFARIGQICRVRA